MRFLLLSVLITGVLSFSLQADRYDATKLTDQPGTQLIKPLLAVISSGDAEKLKSFAKKNFHPAFLEDVPIETHVEVLLNINAQHGELTFYSLRTYDEPLPKNQLVAIF